MLNDTEKATSDFRKAIEIDPSNGEPYFWICLAHDDINYCKLAAKLVFLSLHRAI